MDNEIFTQLKQSVQEMKAIERGEIKPGRVAKINEPSLAEARRALKMTQDEFSTLIEVPVATLRGYEQGRYKIPGPVRFISRIATRNPEILLNESTHRRAILDHHKSRRTTIKVSPVRKKTKPTPQAKSLA